MSTTDFVPQMDKQIYTRRRQQVTKAIGKDGIAVIPTAVERARNRDNNFPYRHDSYFYYLSGFTEPHACLLITGEGHTTLWCQPKDIEREVWDGYRLGPDAAPDFLGVDAAYPITELAGMLPRLLENRAIVYYPFATHEGLAAQMEIWLDSVRARARYGAQCPREQGDLCAILDEMRLYKDAHELSIMRRAGRISAQAHIRAMQTAACMLREGQDTREYHLDAALSYEFLRHGAQFPAYTSIVAAGANACVLHYRAGATPIQSGDVVLIDAGCELDGYASDISRSFPANSVFTAAQREIYDLVLAAQEAAIATSREGKRFNDVHDAAVEVLAQGLLDLKILDANQAGSVQDVIENRSYFPFYMHRTGHWLGMDVHDCGSYAEPSESHIVTERVDALTGQKQLMRPSRILRAGMVTTIEPGLYFRAAENVPERYWNIGIRIEDDAVITPGGQACELLTRGVPVQAGEIERIMR